MNRPEQTVHIMDGDTVYSFDVVIQAEHKHTMDVLEDEKSANGKEHVQYAVRKPSTLTLEVSVLDTVSVMDEPLTNGATSRSESAYANLYNLMQKRSLLTVVTRMHTFAKMLISDLVVTEDPEHQFEMYANVGFKEMTVVPKKKKRPPPDDDDEDVKPEEEEESTMREQYGVLVPEGETKDTGNGERGRGYVP